MDKTQKAVVFSLIGTSAAAWIASIQQPDMMIAMTSYNPLAISLFTASWTVGMAAMMFPAITPMVLLYNTFVKNGQNKVSNSFSVTVQEGTKPNSSIRSLRVILFIGCYLLVWSLTGVALLLGWSVVMNSTIMTAANSAVLPTIYGSILIVAGAYQFTPLKKICIGYCESPVSFFLRRWKNGTSGAVKMGVWHGLYCLGCCWAYFLLMVALGWMNLLWMSLFAGVIFGEKIWSRGIWVARAAGVGLAIVGLLVISGLLPSLVESATTMSGPSPEGTPMDGMNMGMDMGIDSQMSQNTDDDIEEMTDEEISQENEENMGTNPAMDESMASDKSAMPDM